ncbi:OmpH family outer membrane protein [Pirellulales bacterium]|nr:OmpH family outer membrane protein [Pirellulales bacterium]
MRTVLIPAAVIALAVAPAPVVSAQSNPAGANASKYSVAVVDVSWIFKNYTKFKSEMNQMQADMKTAEANLKTDRDRIQRLEEERNDLKPTSEEFKQLDEQLARQKADFNIKAGKIRRDLLEREAKVYYQTYLEVSNVVKYFAQHNNIGLVLRFNGDTVDPSKREDVLRAINQPIMHQNSIDITPDVLGLLNQNGGGAVTSSAAGGLERR